MADDRFVQDEHTGQLRWTVADGRPTSGLRANTRYTTAEAKRILQSRKKTVRLVSDADAALACRGCGRITGCQCGVPAVPTVVTQRQQRED